MQWRDDIKAYDIKLLAVGLSPEGAGSLDFGHPCVEDACVPFNQFALDNLYCISSNRSSRRLSVQIIWTTG